MSETQPNVIVPGYGPGTYRNIEDKPTRTVPAINATDLDQFNSENPEYRTIIVELMSGASILCAASDVYIIQRPEQLKVAHHA